MAGCLHHLCTDRAVFRCLCGGGTSVREDSGVACTGTDRERGSVYSRAAAAAGVVYRDRPRCREALPASGPGGRQGLMEPWLPWLRTPLRILYWRGDFMRPIVVAWFVSLMMAPAAFRSEEH